jgi:hypothetical protein
MFESVTALTQEQIEWLDECAKRKWSLNPQTGLVDVKEVFYCSEQGLLDFKGIKFGVVGGDFDCEHSQLTSLEGAPQKVGGDFYCNNNQLTSLEGSPREVGGDFYCEHNQLTSLEGAPQKVGGDFDCEHNQLTSLEGSPQKVGEHFYCRDNRLTSLEGAPQKVGGDFRCENNQLDSLVGAPQKVGGTFFCENNQLTSLEGAPQRVDGRFFCGSNPVSWETFQAIFTKMQKSTSYLAAVESLWSKIPQDDQVLLYADDFKWVTPEQGRGIVSLRAYQAIRGML